MVLIDVCMPELDGFELAAMIREHPRFQKTAIIFISAVHARPRSTALRGYRDGRGRLRPGAGHSGGAAGQGQGVRRTLPQDPPARAAQPASWKGASRSGPPSSRPPTRDSLKASSVAALALGRRPDGGMGLGRRATADALWDEGQYRIFGVDARTFDLTFEEIRRFIHPEDLTRIKRLIAGDRPRARPSDRGANSAADRRDSLVHLRRRP